MTSYRKLTAAWTLGLVATVSAFAQTAVLAQPGSQLPQDTIADSLNPESIDAYGEELLRGPVHEAFAEQYNQDPIDGVTIDRAPPPPVNEIPPEIRPDGDNVEWLSGYWFWDDGRNDFLWISGTWRVIPPGHRWLPGYWAQLSDQAGAPYQWVSGAWVPTQQDSIEYIAQSPPETLDYGPAGVAPSENHFWIPGCWTWAQNDYAWRPGYWSAGYSNWVWVPQRYLWTPRGYVFHNGYWDYPIAQRGTLFAPFYFNQPVYARSNFFYSPRVSILANLLQSHFWVRPRFHHYYFGDFYAANYRNVGIIPWHSYHRGVGFQSRRHGFDPLFAHASLYNRSGGGNFYQQINNQYNVFVNQVDRRPSLTYRDQLQRGDRGRGGFNDDRFNRGPSVGGRNDSFLGESIRDLAQRDPNRFTRLSTEQVTRIRDASRDAPSLTALRRENETSSRGRDRSSNRSAAGSLADRLQLPPVERGRFGDDRPTTADRSRSEGRYSSGRPGIDRPASDRTNVDRTGSDRPGSDRPSLSRPGSDSPGVERPASDRPSVERPGPSAERPSRDLGSGSPLGGSRISDQIRDRIPQSNRPAVDRGRGESGRVQPAPTQPAASQPGRTLPGIGTSPTRPQIGTPSSQPLRTPGFGDRSGGRLSSPTLSPNDSGRSSRAQRPSPSVTPSPSLRTPLGGGSTPSPRSGLSSPSSRPQVTPQTSRSQGRPQVTPRPSGGGRPSTAPSVRGNRGGGDSNRGPGISSPGRRG